MGGVWEWVIGMIRKIFDLMFLEFSGKFLIYEILVIFLCEVCVIINFRLIVLIFLDLNDLMIFILIMIFIGKVDFLLVVFDLFSL